MHLFNLQTSPIASSVIIVMLNLLLSPIFLKEFLVDRSITLFRIYSQIEIKSDNTDELRTFC